MRIIKGLAEMRSASTEARMKGLEVVFVPTMGYLHEGHKRLLEIGKGLSGNKGVLVLSIFVNPAQFGPKEDLKSYPRDLDRDLKLAKEAGVDIVFIPEADEMYPEGYRTYVEVERIPDHLCGLARPGHFRGVATVVLKLFNIVMPAKAVFGKKDYQQLLVIKKMAGDLNLGVDIIGAETVREPDGLAMSSRNSYLNAEERKAASVIPASLEAAKREFRDGVRESSRIIGKVEKIIEEEPLAVIEYIKVCDKDSLDDLESIKESALLAVAVKVGKARLIDNCLLG